MFLSSCVTSHHRITSASWGKLGNKVQLMAYVHSKKCRLDIMATSANAILMSGLN
jgi:hypothetical protein